MTRVETWLAAILTVVAIAPVWLVEHPPLQDYPYHLARVNVLAHYDDPALAYRDTFVVSAYPAPYVLADWLMAGLGRLLGIETAGKVVLSLYLALFPWSLGYLAGAARPAGSAGWAGGPAVLLGFLLAFNWHFHMGFVSYVLSLPAALFALGWWWRGRDDLRWGRIGGLAGLVLLTYLLHIYAFGVLAFVLVFLALVEGWRRGWRRERPWGGAREAAGRLARTLAAFVPALALLAGAVLRNVGRSAGGEGPLLLLYGNLRRKVLLAAGSLPSFDLACETALFAAGVATVLALAAVAWRHGRRPSWPWLAAAAALVVLFLALPDHLGRVFFVSNRVPLFVLLLAVAALPVPPAGAGSGWGGKVRSGAAVLLSVLAVLHIGSLTLRYRQIDRELADYAAALRTLPADARVAFRADEEAMSVGRIAPAALFGGYHYLRAPGSRIPDLEHFVGTLRTVDYRSGRGRSLSTASAGSREELADLLGRPWIVGPGGWLISLGDETPLLAETARRYGFEVVGAAGPATVRRKVRARFRTEAEPAVYATGYEDDWDYLVTFGDTSEPAGAASRKVFERGRAAVYRCRAAAGCAVAKAAA